MASHIRLFRSDRDETGMMLVPLAGTTFELAPDYATVVVLANGVRITVEESLSDIASAIEPIVVVEG